MPQLNKKKHKNPIAIVGLAFRFPGDLSNSQVFWQSLMNKESQICEMDDSRWPQNKYYHPNKEIPGCSYVKKAGLLSDPFSFDAPFFNIPPREAIQMDPQQRILLELSWHAIEDAGILPKTLSLSKTGVYIGVGAPDYGVSSFITDVGAVDSQTMLGNTNSIVSNRLSYFLDLKGPSMSIDTACSSSLVAVHQACHSLWNGETEHALVGGCNLICHPFPFVGFSKALMLSPSGECRSFDANGDGYVRSEGAAILLLKPLSKALQDKNNIHAIIVNTGMNSDGKTSSLPVPSIEAQSTLLEQLYIESDIDPNDLDYFEAHGTGTAIGDPIEAKAIGESLAKKRKTPLMIGSIKPNLGHLECGSGMAGIVKLIHCLRHQKVPANLHFETPNPDINFSELNVKVIQQTKDLSAKEKELLMGVNSFGFGGTNAHCILKEYQGKINDALRSPKKLPPLRITANTDNALKTLIESYLSLIKETPEKYYNIAYSSFYSRSHLKQGILICEESIEQIVTKLEELLSSDELNSTAHTGKKLKTCFVFTGNGCQWEKMGLSLLKGKFKIVQKTLNKLEKLFKEETPISIKKILFSKDKNRYQQTENAQPALFALQVIITSFITEYGVVIDSVVGHSVGEVSAAWASGALSLRDAVKVIYFRSVLQGKTKGRGKMAAIGLTKGAFLSLRDKLAVTELSIAAENTVNSLTISGPSKCLTLVEEYCINNKVYYKKLDLDYAFHSESMLPIKEELISSLSGITPQKNLLSFFSTVDGKKISGLQLTEEYWWKNVYQTVKFRSVIEEIAHSKNVIFVEIAPNAILQSYIREHCSPQNNVHLLRTLLKEKSERECLVNTLSKLYLMGARVNLNGIFRQKTPYYKLPIYPFEKKDYKIEPTDSALTTFRGTEFPPLLGEKIKGPQNAWNVELSLESECYLGQHIVDGLHVFPGAGFIEQMLSLIRQESSDEIVQLKNIEIFNPLILSNQYLSKVNIAKTNNEFLISSAMSNMANSWQQHAKAILGHRRSFKESIKLSNYKIRMDHTVSGEEHYALCHYLGLTYLGEFKLIDKMWCFDDAILSEYNLSVLEKHSKARHVLYPPLLDAALQSAMGFVRNKKLLKLKESLLVPTKIADFTHVGGDHDITHCLTTLEKVSSHSISVSLKLVTSSGEVVVEAREVRLQALPSKNRSCTLELYNFSLELKRQSYNQSNLYTLTMLTKCIKESRETLVKQAGSTSSLVNLLVASGLFTAIGHELSSLSYASIDSLKDKLGVIQGREPYFHLCLSILRKEGFVSECRATNTISLTKPGVDIDYNLLWLTLFAEHKVNLTDLLVISKLCESLPALIRGSKGFGNVINRNYEYCSPKSLSASSNVGKDLKALVDVTLNKILESWPKNKRKKVLYLVSNNTNIPCSLLTSNMGLELTLYVTKEGSLFDCREISSHLSNVTLINDELVNLSCLAPQSFDLIVFNSCLSESVNVKTVLKDLKNYCNKDSVVLIAELLNSDLNNFYFGSQEQWWIKDGDNYSSPLFSARSLNNLLLKEGYLSTEDLIIETFENAYLVATQPLSISQQHESLTLDELIVLANIGDQESIKTCLKPMCDVLTFATKSEEIIKLLDISNSTKTTENAFGKLLYFLNATPEGFSVTEFHSEIFSVINDLRSMVAAQHCSSFELVVLIEEKVSCNPLSKHFVFHTVQSILRVFNNEYPSIRFKLIKLEQPLSEVDASLLNKALHEHESEIVINQVGFFVNKLHKTNNFYGNGFQEGDEKKLDFQQMGSLDNLQWFSCKKGLLNDNEVLIKPMAAGLNFRDVMYTMGFVTDEALESGFLGASLGMEFSGIVTGLGAQSKKFKIGDLVFGFSKNSFSSSIIVTEEMVHALPEGWSHLDAATVPVTFFTAFYALKQQAKLLEGERILIHGGAGGVGIAAIQIASFLGAEIITTAGNDEKRLFLKRLGLQHVFNSRDLSFVDEIKNSVGDVDVVLNCLSGEAIEESLALLAPFGRFLELGKRDFYANSKIGLNPFKNNISYFGVDVDQLIYKKPKVAQSLFEDLLAVFKTGSIKPLPYVTFNSSKIQDAFRYMQQAKQIGKIVIKLDDLATESCKVIENEYSALSAVRYYLITGGTRGLGLKTAQLFIQHGAKNILLLSKSGELDSDASRFINSCTVDLDVTVLKADLGDLSALKTVLSPYLSQLAGVVHAANEYHDAMIEALTPDLLNKTVQAKGAGAWNLHCLTKCLDLEFFVLYSSVANYIGNVGQVGYVSANAMLDALANYRRTLGLCCKVMSFGPISDAGFLATNKNVLEHLEEHGIKALPASSYLSNFFRVLERETLNDCLCIFDFSILYQVLPTIDLPIFSNFKRFFNKEAISSNNNLLEIISDLENNEKIHFLSKILSDEIINILKLPVDSISHTEPFSNLGLDSIMGVELVHVMEKRLSTKIPLMILSQGTNIYELSKKILEHIEMIKQSNKNQFDDHFEKLEAQHNVVLSSKNREMIINEVSRDLRVVS